MRFPAYLGVTAPLAAALLASVATAGDEEPARPVKAPMVGKATSAKLDSSAVRRSLRLPVLAHRTRDQGVPDADVKSVVTSLREAKMAPADAVETLEAALSSIDAKGPVENFGEFVKGKLGEGLRGPRLAKAIRDEHDRRGIGKGKKLARGEKDRGKHLGHDLEAKAEHAAEHGTPQDDAEKPSGRPGGKPEPGAKPAKADKPKGPHAHPGHDHGGKPKKDTEK